MNLGIDGDDFLPEVPDFDGESLFNMVIFWAAATLNCSERVLSDADHSPWESERTPSSDSRVRTADSALMVLAMRNLLRAASFVGRTLQDRTESDPEEALQRFDARLPGIVQARDALEHFDEYAIGRGRMQRERMIPYEFFLAQSAEGPVVTVGPISINVLRAREECRALVISLLAALEGIEKRYG